MDDHRGAYVELVKIKISFKAELEGCRDKARQVLKKIAWFLVRGNGEYAEAYREEAIKIRNQARELVSRIQEVRRLQKGLRRR